MGVTVLILFLQATIRGARVDSQDKMANEVLLKPPLGLKISSVVIEDDYLVNYESQRVMKFTD